MYICGYTIHTPFTLQLHAVYTPSGIRLSRAGLRYHDRPLGVFMLLGGTGVGKTEVSKALTEFIFSDASAMLRSVVHMMYLYFISVYIYSHMLFIEWICLNIWKNTA